MVLRAEKDEALKEREEMPTFFFFFLKEVLLCFATLGTGCLDCVNVLMKSN